MKLCLCKECDHVDITTLGDIARYEAILLCRCCLGLRLIPYSWEVSRCPNRLRSAS